MIAAFIALIALLVIGAALTLYAATAVSGKSQENEETPADVPNAD